jgi:hypothetical protein
MALSLAIAPSFAFTSAAAAEGEITWSVTPAADASGARESFQYSVDPGVQINDTVLITNSGATAAEFSIYATDAVNVEGTGDFGLLQRQDAPTDVGAWITLPSEKLTLEPGAQASVPFSLVIPSDASPGEHVAGIVASVISETTDAEGAAVTLEQRVGARVYLEISGTKIADVEVAGLSSSYSPSWNPFGGGQLALSFDLRNTGNQRVDVAPKVTVAGPFGIPLAEVELDPVQELLPRQSFRMSTDLPAVAALALVWSTVTVTPSPVGTLDDAAEEEESEQSTPTPTPTPTESIAPAPTDASGASVQDVVVTDEELAFEPVSETTMGFAISWTLLAVIVAAIIGAYLVWRYITATRERMYLAIDEATETARQEALAAREDGR